MKLQANFDRGVLPKINIDWLVLTICTGQLQNSWIQLALFRTLPSTKTKQNGLLEQTPGEEQKNRKLDQKPKSDNLRVEQNSPPNYRPTYRGTWTKARVT